nr:DUF2301 domain-containing membrane protein [Richelia intracellularis]
MFGEKFLLYLWAILFMIFTIRKSTKVILAEYW